MSVSFFFSLKILSIMLFLFGLGNSALSSTYDVDGLFVQADARDAVTAKTEAISRARFQGFYVVLKRITPILYHKRLPKPGNEFVQNLVEGIVIRRERNTRTHYSAKIRLRFNPKYMKSFLRRSGIPFYDVQAPTCLLFTSYRQKDDVSLASNNLLGRAWSTLDLENSLTPLVLTRYDEKFAMKDVKELLAGNLKIMDSFQGLYRVNCAFFSLCETIVQKGKEMISCYLKGKYGIDFRHKVLVPLNGVIGDRIFPILRSSAALLLRNLEEFWKQRSLGRSVRIFP
ncbi:MAG: hypothetical protein PSN37_04500 [Alphaproteobacteria bacterium]|nr:hypothetical protein [Alphaproteobacteria bacterium]